MFAITFEQEAWRTEGRCADTAAAATSNTMQVMFANNGDVEFRWGAMSLALGGTNPALFVADANPLTTTSPLDTDSDNDGLADGVSVMVVGVTVVALVATLALLLASPLYAAVNV